MLLPTTLRDAWARLAANAMLSGLEALVTEHIVATLQRSERLQQALYEIADLAGSALEMGEVLARIHAVVGTLMTAENFYIVLYDDLSETLRFLYFVDAHDPWTADPEQELHVSEMPNSLTIALLRAGQPMLGPSAQLRRMHGVDDGNLLHGPDSADWLGFHCVATAGSVARSSCRATTGPTATARMTGRCWNSSPSTS